jgi:ubiquinol-cytochrome c reductase cytochrome c subunit
MAVSRRHPAALFAVLAVGLGTTGTTYAAVSHSTAARPATTSATQVDQGKSLFLEGCSSCHGLAGQGSSDGPSLIGVGAAAVDFQVGSGRMPLAGPAVQATDKTPSYNEDEIAAMAAYVATLGPGPAIPTEEQLDTTGADVVLGGEIFRTNCAQCHNVAGRGGALSEGRWAPSLMAAEPKEILEAMLTGPQAMPIFSDKTITPEEKKAVIKYIEELQAEVNPGGYGLGRLGPVTEGMFLFVFGLGALIGVAVWIGAKAK